MGFSTALSGLNAASNNLTVIGNNIANANTYGFKESRSEFVDSYAESLADSSKVQPGSGVRLAQVAQQFSQGNVELTGGTLDMAINGDGFFTLASSADDTNSRIYSRNGAFHLNKDGIITNSQGQALLAYRPNGSSVAAGFSTRDMQAVSLKIGASKPIPTATIDIDVNLKKSMDEIDPITVPFDPTKDTTYSHETSIKIYDSLGTAHKLTTYFVAGPTTGNEREWTVHNYITDDPTKPISLDSTPPATLKFNQYGDLTSPADGKVTLAPFTIPGSSAAQITASMDFSGSTQIDTDFTVDSLKQDGLPSGAFTNVSIDKDGVIFANFTNGGSTPLGKVALTRFTNPQGLSKLGDGAWAESSASGFPLTGNAGEGNFGTVQSGALEQSNVDLSKQLVNLIIAQQTYQANSQTIQTENSSIQTIMQLR